jgi:hypothetical protein
MYSMIYLIVLFLAKVLDNALGRSLLTPALMGVITSSRILREPMRHLSPVSAGIRKEICWHILISTTEERL